jgi:hypothetical protein
VGGFFAQGEMVMEYQKGCVLEAISDYTLEYFCLAHGSTLRRILKRIHLIIQI